MALLFPLAFRLDHGGHGSAVLDVALHPTHRLLASALDSGTLTLHIYEPAEGGTASLQLWPGHRLQPFAGAVQPDCTAVCFVSSAAGSDGGGTVVAGSPAGSLFAADVETGRGVWAQRAAGHNSRIKAATPVGPQLLATGDSHGAVCFWDLRAARPTSTLQLSDGGVTDLCAVADKDALLASSSNGLEGGIATFSLRWPQILSSWQHASGLQAVAALHSGRTVVCGDEQGKWGFGRWGQLKGKEVAFRAAHGAAAVSALVQCTDTGIVSASSDGTIRASRIDGPPIEVSSRAAVQAHAGGSRVRLSVSGSGSYVASAAVGEAVVQLWHTHLLFQHSQGSPAVGASSPLPKLTLRRDAATAAAAAAAAAEAEAAAQRQRQQRGGGGSGEQQEQACIICMDAAATGGFAHKGSMHSGFCAACIRAERQRRPGVCPACREPVDAYIERTF